MVIFTFFSAFSGKMFYHNILSRSADVRVEKEEKPLGITEDKSQRKIMRKLTYSLTLLIANYFCIIYVVSSEHLPRK